MAGLNEPASANTSITTARRRVMRPERLAAIQPSRLSITRSLMNKDAARALGHSRNAFDIDAAGAGTVVYSIKTPSQEFSFIAFSFPPSRTARTGRIIGRAWDMMGTLNEGPATKPISRRCAPNCRSFIAAARCRSLWFWGARQSFDARVRSNARGTGFRPAALGRGSASAGCWSDAQHRPRR